LEGPGSENSVKCSQNLASALVGLGDEDSIVEAGALYQQGLAVRAATLGVDDPLTLISKVGALSLSRGEHGSEGHGSCGLRRIVHISSTPPTRLHHTALTTSTLPGCLFMPIHAYDSPSFLISSTLVHGTLRRVV